MSCALGRRHTHTRAHTYYNYYFSRLAIGISIAQRDPTPPPPIAHRSNPRIKIIAAGRMRQVSAITAAAVGQGFRNSVGPRYTDGFFWQSFSR